MSRPTSPAQERILDVANGLFYTHGIRAVGIDRIIAEADVAKATLYAHFKCKNDLVAAYLRREDKWWRSQLQGAAGGTDQEPRQQLVAAFDALGPALSRYWPRGCPFINATAEFEAGSLPYEVAVGHKAAVRSWFLTIAESAKTHDPQLLAGQLTMVLDGALASRLIDEPDRAVASAKRTVLVLVGAS